jgi:hypothetical protein
VQLLNRFFTITIDDLGVTVVNETTKARITYTREEAQMLWQMLDQLFNPDN